MVSACLEARRVTGEGIWMERARRAFNWFLGENQLRQPLYDVTTGGCRDGLHADRVNANQGAESTLSFLLALSEMQSVDGAKPVGGLEKLGALSPRVGEKNKILQGELVSEATRR
jgi:hypothetical protein